MNAKQEWDSVPRTSSQALRFQVLVLGFVFLLHPSRSSPRFGGEKAFDFGLVTPAVILLPMTLSVCIITFNEEANIGRTLSSVKDIADEIVVVDSGSTDATVAIAQSFGAKVFSEPWKGFALQKNSSLAKAGCDWILSLDADEEASPELAAAIKALLRPGAPEPPFRGYKMPPRNLYMGHWLNRPGYYPDPTPP